MTHGKQITDLSLARTFILAGNATFTLVSEKTGVRFTYKVRASKPQDEGKSSVHFVSLLTGSDNENDYSYLGIIRSNNDFGRTSKSRITDEALGHKAFAWFWRALQTAIPEQVQLWHEGRCGACGRMLTVPESIATGLGPDCSERLGVARVETGRK